MSDEREIPFDEQVFALAFHRSQKCPHGMGSEPKPMPKDYLKRDYEIAAVIAAEYRVTYEEVVEAIIEKSMDELVEMGLVEAVPA